MSFSDSIALVALAALFAGASALAIPDSAIAQETLAPEASKTPESKSAAFPGFVKARSLRIHYRVEADGTYTEEYEQAIEVLSEQGIQSVSTQSVAYSASLSEAEITQAYTLKKDGRRIPASAYQESKSSGSDGRAPVFSDYNSKTVVFPEVETGDAVVFSYRRRQREAVFPGHFSVLHTFDRDTLVDAAEISLEAPASLPLKIQAQGVESQEFPEENGWRRWVWKFRNEKIVLPEPWAVFDFGPSEAFILVSSFADYGAIAAAYDARAREKAQVTPRVRELAERIAADAKTPREEAQRLYEWVSRNIQFADNRVGSGSVVPRDTGQILDNRMGDCKDYTVLYQALLAARGIESTPVLVNSGNIYNLPDIAWPWVFDHSINYIPSLDLYVDASVKSQPFGELPFSESNKPVIHTADFRGIRTTPAQDYRKDRSASRTRMTIQGDGSASGETWIEESGRYAPQTRGWMKNRRSDRDALTVRRTLLRNGYRGEGTFSGDDPDKLGQEYRYRVDYRLLDVIPLPGPGAFSFPPPVDSASTLNDVLRFLVAEKRTKNFVCAGYLINEEISARLPPGIEVLELPKNAAFAAGYFNYRAEYTLEGGEYTIRRTLEAHPASNVCTPQQQEEAREAAAAIRRDLRRQLIYR
ncbi:MAG: DUF3857 and transglutaminase domain-containing protein [Betaproteobacteria bacterium]|nr:DUF3857 and transglutaminase domain-containing protein [Betaproteobacteria bacterium]